MSKLTMTRRSFLKAAAVTGAAAALVSGAAAGNALAEETASAASSAGVAKRIRSCCRGCGKMECGVWVTVQDGKVIRIEGDVDAFQSDGNCCTKSQASVQAAYHPDRMMHPLKRTNPKSEMDPQWERITWDEAFNTSGAKLKELIAKYGGPSLFAMVGTSRVWSMAGISAWLSILGTPNNIQAYQICKGPRHFGTRMVCSNAFSWMETVSRPRVYVQWGGAAEISNYDDSCRTAVDVSTKADYHILVDPRTHGIARMNDYWCNLRPGTDAAVALCWANVIIKNELYDDLYVKKWTNLAFLMSKEKEASGFMNSYRWGEKWEAKTNLITKADLEEGGDPKIFVLWDTIENVPFFFNGNTGIFENQVYTAPTAGKDADQPGMIDGPIPGWVLNPTGFDVADGFDRLYDPALFGEYPMTLKDGRTIKCKPAMDFWYEEIKDAYTPEKAAEITGIDAKVLEESAKAYATRIDPATGYGNGGILYMLAIEHAGNAIQNVRAIDALTALTGNMDTPAGHRGPTLAPVQGGFTPFAAFCPGAMGVNTHMEKVIGQAKIPMLKWWAGWADANAMYDAMNEGDPYPVVGGINTSGDFMNMANAQHNFESLCKLDFILEQNLWHAPSTDTADILMPVQHWTEVSASRVSQGASGAFGATVQAIEPPADTKWDPVIVQEIAKQLGVNYSTDKTNPWPGKQWILEYAVAGFGVSWDEYNTMYQKQGWWDAKVVNPVTWGTYRRYECKTLNSRTGLVGWATPTTRHEILSTVMCGHHPGEGLDFPTFFEPPHSPVREPERAKNYPFIVTTGRRIPVYFHNEHRQLPWCRELWPCPRVEINPEDAEELGIEQGDWVWIETEWGKVRQAADLYYGIKKGTINCEHQWWYPEISERGRGYSYSSINCVNDRTAQCPHCGATNVRAYVAKIYKATAENSPNGNPCPTDSKGNEIIHTPGDPRLVAWAVPNYDREA